MVAVLLLEVHADSIHDGPGFALDCSELGPAWVQNLHYASEGLCPALHSDPEILEGVVDTEKYQKVVLWKMVYFHVDERVVERGCPPGNSLEEEGLDLLGLAEISWVLGDNKGKESDH